MSTPDPYPTLLDHADPTIRRQTLEHLHATSAHRAAPADSGNINLHMHSFFSYNAYGWSPSRVAWEAHRAGFYAAGLCDFDVLDGVAEFLDAGLTLGLRTVAHLETRVFVPEMNDREITSPGEPGVTYIMGAGFVRPPATGTAEAAGLAAYRAGARARNEALIARVNARLPDIALDYARDVLPLTPAGNATERHLIRAFVERSHRRWDNPGQTAGFWAQVLGKPAEELLLLDVQDPARFEELVRAKLAKRGGIGYEQPSQNTFPPIAAFTAWVRASGAIPMLTWLDGTSAGEQDPRALLDAMAAHGCVAANIIPDRNWNVTDLVDRARKIANLKAFVAEADRRHWPLNIGTEMNRAGLPLVDDLAGTELAPYRETFLHGARVMVGHSLLARYADHSYLSPAALAEFPDLARRNSFFAAVGALPPLTATDAAGLRDAGPTAALAWFRRHAGR